MKNLAEQVLEAYTRDIIDNYFNSARQFYKVYPAPDSENLEDNCDGFCPECAHMVHCEAYEEIKDGWETFYT
ncbi:MAG: hypothetical protein C4560_09310 [Nitrospiraceae bacterium]|nr:MAG: hypothetical protein C4560_09310 [Nitrospiraceae bacterium]